MSTVREPDKSDSVHIGLASTIRHVNDPFMVLNDHLKETSLWDTDSQSVNLNKHQSDRDSKDAGAESTEQSRSDKDLYASIPGMYRILDLISERGTSGLVNKIIVAQDSLNRFLNKISPGAYSSLTKVDFKVLNKFQVKPLGVYGSKDEIVRFLLSVAIINNTIASKLTDSTDGNVLRSGLYICCVPSSVGTMEKVYVIYWPEESTWDDEASPPVRRNRITFMRYLTKICDQVVALISADHAKSMIWSDQLSRSDENGTGRLFTFEVAKKKEQAEGVSMRQGFKCSLDVVITDIHPECHLDPALLKPRLLFGETRQGFFTTRYIPVQRSIKFFDAFKINAFLLQDALLKDHLHISEAIDPTSLDHLVRFGLEKRFPEECRIWAKEVDAIRLAHQEDVRAQQNRAQDWSSQERAQTESSMRLAVVNVVFSRYPTLDRHRCFTSDAAFTPEEESRLGECYSNLTTAHPRIAESFSNELCRANCKNISEKSFRKSKEKILLALYLQRNLTNITEAQLNTLLGSVFKGNKRQLQTNLAIILHEIATPTDQPTKPTTSAMKNAERMLNDGRYEPSLINDPDFVADLDSLSSTMPVLQEAVKVAKDQAQKYLGNIVEKLCCTLLTSAHQIQLEDAKAQLRLERRSELDLRNVNRSLIKKLNTLSESCDSPHTLCLKSVVRSRDVTRHEKRSQSFDITGHRETSKEASLLFTVHLMHLTTQDKHELQLDPTKIPNPHFKVLHSFHLPLRFSISHSQLLEGDRLFLVLIDRNGNLHLHLDHLSSIENSIERERSKMIRRDEVGDEFLLAFDESQAMLALISRKKLQLHVFVYDDCRGFTPSGSTVLWLGKGKTIEKACFASGGEELLLVDSQAIARVFSLTTMQFRPASLDLHHVPIDVFSSPDGSCFLLLVSSGTSTRIIAHHWSIFGSTDGVSLPIADWAGDGGIVISSLIRRSAVYLLKLNLSSLTCTSVALEITRKVTRFMFKEKDGHCPLSRGSHNSLMDCHADLWAYFPVLPAVQRAIISSGDRRCHSILFVADRDFNRYKARFVDMVTTFERTTKKPTGDVLSTLQVSAMAFNYFVAEFSPRAEWENVSPFLVGEWVVAMLCLIPIHLGLVRDDRFLPLKDGIVSVEGEKNLVGAEINHIVDSISFGWYEPIFQSYVADKPVRVVSSMGEQSVGKSFMLNHLADTSFAGPEMSPTEGVWMSVTPTKEALIVALDFEGIHNMERSAQEDTLLVLFNTAISNLVLFRSNFALSRDITELFQSFQSSLTVLDPVENPELFKSTLAIIIKDVVDSDKTEIARQFSLKLQHIVEEEQDSNFISCLHGGKLDIIPWPVIESKEFYELFPMLKMRLDQQAVTHKAAGEFLHLVKTLMAKLKANDWGALSQNMASHRAQSLLALLPTALAFGMQSVEPNIELLKNLDTAMAIDIPDTDARFSIVNSEHPKSLTREEALYGLLIAWDEFDSRRRVPDSQWVERLTRYLEDLVEMRINHVRAWVRSNLTRFQADHASVMEFQRTLEDATIDLKSSVQICRAQCASCQLLCIQNQFHEGVHDCKMIHVCTQSCEYCTVAGALQEGKRCSKRDGHPGKHVCSSDVHLCGVPCELRGCLEGCAKPPDHEDDDHRCAAIPHACGEPCYLCFATFPDGSENMCSGRCRISIDIEHKAHQCDAQYCPIPCQLCGRLCSSSNHLHALEVDAIHLCGELHACFQRCTAPGVCEIDTAPESTGETSKGIHESIQYTKHLQVAKRLKCVRPIPPGQLQHEGLHNHSLDPNVIHYCQARCPGCQHYCTLPIGHSQREHETCHGSISKIEWFVDGINEGLGVKGREFSADDEAATCNLICRDLGRHVHIDYCRAKTPAECQGNAEVQHLTRKLSPEPDRPKDCVTHNLFWRRTGFKDPYSREEQENFAKCDSMCAGLEHSASGGKPAVPSYCILPLFHAPLDASSAHPTQGYISSDGHQFMYRNPSTLQRPFHIIFLMDRSMSMAKNDITPASSSTARTKILGRGMNNRLGAVYAALHNFWTARQAASCQQRDANTIILHSQDAQSACENDTTRSPDELLDLLLPNRPHGGNCFDKALKAANASILKCWDDARPPLIIFLSDGIASVGDGAVRKLFRTAAQKGKGLSLHAILFGPKTTSTRMERMVTVALDAQSKTPALRSLPSSFHEALDAVQLSQTFLGIAESLGKHRRERLELGC